MSPIDGPAPRASSVAHSTFFKLAPELRSNIYRLVLGKDDDDWDAYGRVMVDGNSGVLEPALLLRNKVIRSEASGIFYYQNSFCCRVSKFDPALILPLQSKLTVPFRDHPMQVFIKRANISVNGTNLVSWLYMCHRGECPGLDRDEETGRYSEEKRLLEGLFEVVLKCSEISPSTLQVVIDSTYLALETVNMNGVGRRQFTYDDRSVSATVNLPWRNDLSAALVAAVVGCIDMRWPVFLQTRTAAFAAMFNEAATNDLRAGVCKP